MLDDWQITCELRDLPPEVWDFLKAPQVLRDDHPEGVRRARFFRLRAFGGDPQAVVALDARRAVTAMVPNSLGPGELLLQFGTKAQQDYWLPRLADGDEIPCFGLTSPEAGSDAAVDDRLRRRLPRHL